MVSYTHVLGILAAFILLVIVIFVATQYSPKTTVGTSVSPLNFGGTKVVIEAADPSMFPVGTEALVISYSNLTLYKNGTTLAGAEKVGGYGSLNLSSLSNYSQTIGVYEINSSDEFDSASFDISSASITINNITYNLAVPNKEVFARFNGVLGRSMPIVLINIAPFVMQSYGAGNSGLIFGESAKGITFTGNASEAAYISRRNAILNQTRYESTIAGPRISIVNASLEQNGKNTVISISIKNIGGSNTTIKDVQVFGYMRLANGTSLLQESGFGRNDYHTYAPIMLNLNGASLLNNVTSLWKYVNISVFQYELKKQGINVSQLNVSGISVSKFGGIFGLNNQTISLLKNVLPSGLNVSILNDVHSLNVSNSSIMASIKEANFFSKSYHNMLNFVVESNGGLELPPSEQSIGLAINHYNISPEGSAVLQFSGVLKTGSGSTILFIPNQTYAINVIGADGASASINVTAG